MVKLTLKILVTSSVFAVVSAGIIADVIYQDDFSSGTVLLDPRVDQADIGQGWAASSGWSGNGNVDSNWAVEVVS